MDWCVVFGFVFGDKGWVVWYLFGWYVWFGVVLVFGGSVCIFEEVGGVVVVVFVYYFVFFGCCLVVVLGKSFEGFFVL